MYQHFDSISYREYTDFYRNNISVPQKTTRIFKKCGSSNYAMIVTAKETKGREPLLINMTSSTHVKDNFSFMNQREHQIYTDNLKHGSHP